MKYKILAHEDNHELSRVVCTYIQKGWSLYGLLNVTTSSVVQGDKILVTDVPHYAQALIKREKGDE